MGYDVGVAPDANLVFVRTGTYGGVVAFEKFVEAFLLIADDGHDDAPGHDEGVVNLSFGVPIGDATDESIAGIWCKFLSRKHRFSDSWMNR